LIHNSYWLSATGMGAGAWRNMHASTHTQRWRKEGDFASFPKPVYNYNSAQYGTTTDMSVFDGSYLRLRNLTFGYNLPQNWTKAMGLTNLRLFTQGTNLLTFTKYPAHDPEVGGGRNIGQASLGYPNAKTIIFGIDLKF